MTNETVYIGTKYRARRMVYHTDPECLYFPEKVREVELAVIEPQYRECRGCQGNEDDGEAQDWSYQRALKEAAQQ